MQPDKDQELSGSRSVVDTGSLDIAEVPPANADGQIPDEVATLREQLANAQKLIGKHSGEVANSRQKIAEYEGKIQELTPKGPSIDEQIDAISERMENGDLSLRDGNREIARLSAELGKQSALSEIETRNKQERVQSVQQQFLDKNQDYHEVVASGVLKPYMDEDPLVDEFTAFKMHKKDLEHQAKLEDALNKRGRIVAGADNASKVLGRNGIAPRPEAVRKFNTTNEATSAMTDALQQFRASKGVG